MFLVVEALIHVVGDMLRWLGFVFRSTQSIQAENLFLRRQLALYIERGDKPRRIDPVTRVSLALLSRFFDWRDALVVVRPETLIRWHRPGWRLFWRLKSRPGRPPIPRAVQALIRRMANTRCQRIEIAASLADGQGERFILSPVWMMQQGSRLAALNDTARRAR